jgi:hypothetical protein
MSDLARRAANVVFAATLFPAASLSAWWGTGRPINETAPGFSPEVPAGYAFGIWGLIFSLFLIYAVRQALPAQAEAPLYRRIGWATAGASLLNTAWMVLAQTFGNGWWLVLVIFSILACALTAFFQALSFQASSGQALSGPRTLDTFDRWVVMPMTGLLAAWLSAAVWLNASTLFTLLVPGRLGLGPVPFALIVLGIIAAFSWAVLMRSGGNVWYAGTTVWALAAVAVANLTNAAGQPVIAATAAGCIAVTALLAWWCQPTTA